MARKLTEPMKEVLRIMAEGHEIELWSGGGRNRWDYVPPPDLCVRPREVTVRALENRKLIEPLQSQDDWPSYVWGRYALTEAGRRREKELT